MRAPQSSTISRAASRCAAIACSGWSCFSNRAEASVRSPSAFEVRMMFGPTQVAASIRTRVVFPDTSEIWPPMIPAIPLGPDDDAAPAHLVEVERVQRLAGGEHCVVRYVHDVRDRALPGRHQALLQ